MSPTGIDCDDTCCPVVQRVLQPDCQSGEIGSSPIQGAKIPYTSAGRASDRITVRGDVELVSAPGCKPVSLSGTVGSNPSTSTMRTITDSEHFTSRLFIESGLVAQLVERLIEGQGVGGSSPFQATIGSAKAAKRTGTRTWNTRECLHSGLAA